ncbi:hypothetical protein DFJ74DRAFT_703203 [Hyaloraphidium curvatum]|nr:hypothetical protein DFJ74DRAFT_703203 [Hyaloraphidium curvatum]
MATDSVQKLSTPLSGTTLTEVSAPPSPATVEPPVLRIEASDGTLVTLPPSLVKASPILQDMLADCGPGSAGKAPKIDFAASTWTKLFKFIDKMHANFDAAEAKELLVPLDYLELQLEKDVAARTVSYGYEEGEITRAEAFGALPVPLVVHCAKMAAGVPEKWETDSVLGPIVHEDPMTRAEILLARYDPDWLADYAMTDQPRVWSGAQSDLEFFRILAANATVHEYMGDNGIMDVLGDRATEWLSGGPWTGSEIKATADALLRGRRAQPGAHFRIDPKHWRDRKIDIEHVLRYPRGIAIAARIVAVSLWDRLSDGREFTDEQADAIFAAYPGEEKALLEVLGISPRVQEVQEEQ